MKVPLIITLLVACAAAQTVPAPALEAVSIRPHDGPLRVMAGLKISGNRVSMEGYSLFWLVREAWNIPNYRLGLEKLQRTSDLDVYYDLAIKVSGTAEISREELRPLLQTMLADRFKLTVHKEMRDLPMSVLVVGKNGPKLKGGTPDTECRSLTGPKAPTDRNYQYSMTNCGISRFVDTLGAVNGKPLVDKTGLTGTYDVNIMATPDFRSANGDQPGDISVSDAVEALGLKIEGQKLPMEIVVVDHAEKPSEN